MSSTVAMSESAGIFAKSSGSWSKPTYSHGPSARDPDLYQRPDSSTKYFWLVKSILPSARISSAGTVLRMISGGASSAAFFTPRALAANHMAPKIMSPEPVSLRATAERDCRMFPARDSIWGWQMMISYFSVKSGLGQNGSSGSWAATYWNLPNGQRVGPISLVIKCRGP